MARERRSTHDLAASSTLMRRHDAPARVLGDELVVGRPRDGAPVLLPAGVAWVWRSLDGWTTRAQLDDQLAGVLPEMAAEDRATALNDFLELLREEGLVDVEQA